jgi:hypothetical protein
VAAERLARALGTTLAEMFAEVERESDDRCGPKVPSLVLETRV